MSIAPKPFKPGVYIDPAEVALASVIAENPITDELLAPLGMSDAVKAAIREVWGKYSEAGLANPRKFSVFYEFDETREGYVVVEMKYDGKLDVGVHVYDENDEECPGSPLWCSELRGTPSTVPDPRLNRVEISEKLWQAVRPVEPIRYRPYDASTISSEKQTAPNAPCPCGSKRKFKKCCGRLP